MTTHCKSCRAEVIHVRDQDGKPQILNKRRVRVYQLGDAGTCRHRQLIDGGPPVLFHISHFLTCPNASEHSKGGS